VIGEALIVRVAALHDIHGNLPALEAVLGEPVIANADLVVVEEGRSFTAIADGLNRDGVPTAQGGKQWYPATVRSTLLRLA
jgi:hypothetical protein